MKVSLKEVLDWAEGRSCAVRKINYYSYMHPVYRVVWTQPYFSSQDRRTSLAL